MSSHLRTTCIPLSVAFHVHNGLLRGLVGDFTFWTSDSSSSKDLWVFRKVAPPPLALFRVGSFQIRFGFEGGVVVANYSLIQWFSFGRVRRLRVVLLMAAPLVFHVLLAKSMASGVVVPYFVCFRLGWVGHGQWYVSVFGGYVMVLFGFCVGGFLVAQWFGFGGWVNRWWVFSFWCWRSGLLWRSVDLVGFGCSDGVFVASTMFRFHVCSGGCCFTPIFCGV
jgi:hypothetical protein